MMTMNLKKNKVSSELKVNSSKKTFVSSKYSSESKNKSSKIISKSSTKKITFDKGGLVVGKEFEALDEDG